MSLPTAFILGGLALIALGYTLDAIARRRHHESAGRWRLLAGFGGIGALFGSFGTPWGEPALRLALRFVLAPLSCCLALWWCVVHVRARLGANVLVDLGKVGRRHAARNMIFGLLLLVPLFDAHAWLRFERGAMFVVYLIVVLGAILLRSVATEAGIVQFPSFVRWERILSYEWGPVSGGSRASGKERYYVDLTVALRRAFPLFRSRQLVVPFDHKPAVAALLAARVP